MADPARRAALGALALALALALLVACARDPRQVAWDDAFTAALPRGGDSSAAAADALLALAARAPRPIDGATATLAAADALLAAGRRPEAVRLLAALASGAPRRPDRARARYQYARLAEASGDLGGAVALYRRLVRTYPDLMPGERSLAHLERLFTARGERGLEAHLAWTHAIYPDLAHTPLGDNLVFFAARAAHARYLASGSRAAADLAEALYRRLDRDHPTGGLWNDAWWERSLLYAAQGRHDDEIAAIRRLQRTYERLSLFGHDDHPYFAQGQLRIARLELLALGRPRDAAQSYATYADRFPLSRHRDDALFWAGCAALAAGDPAAASAHFAALERDHPESKYLRRLDDARRDPRGGPCVPPEVVAVPAPPEEAP